MKKRILALVLAVCLVVSGCPIKAFATEQPITLTEPKVTGLSVSINDGDPVDILSGQSTIEMAAGNKPVFTVTFDDTAMVSKVFVTSTKDGETKYLEAKPENGEYITDGYFDPTNEEYVPGTIGVEYSKKPVVIDENGQVDGLDTSTLKSQLSAQGVSVQNRTESNGEITAQVVLKDMAGEMADVFFDAAVSEFNASAGIDESELKNGSGYIRT